MLNRCHYTERQTPEKSARTEHEMWASSQSRQTGSSFVATESCAYTLASATTRVLTSVRFTCYTSLPMKNSKVARDKAQLIITHT